MQSKTLDRLFVQEIDLAIELIRTKNATPEIIRKLNNYLLSRLPGTSVKLDASWITVREAMQVVRRDRNICDKTLKRAFAPDGPIIATKSKRKNSTQEIWYVKKDSLLAWLHENPQPRPVENWVHAAPLP